MTKLEKNILNAIEDTNSTNSKIDIGVVEDGKSYAIKRGNKTLALYWGEDRVVVVDSNIYSSLATELFILSSNIFHPETGREGKNTLSLSVVAGYYGTDDGKPTQILHTRKENRMFAIIFTAIFFGVIISLGFIAVIAMFTIYRLTGGKKSFMWYLRHI